MSDSIRQCRTNAHILFFGIFLLTAFLAGVLRAAQTPAPAHAVIIHTDRRIGTINPNIYGHFAEHLGHCIEEGIWVGPNSEIPNVRGIRTDVVEALKKIKLPVIRWPGGCFADSYHWQDGIGPRENRPKRINVHWGRVIENNHFGTHEFIDFCRQVGAEPMIAANVGSGTPQEMRDWLEYLNVGSDSTLANLRAKNGHPEPFNVRYICIGNENWGCGGSMDPSHYGLLYRQFSEYCHFPPKEGFYRIACGPSSDSYDWTRYFFKTIVGEETKGRNRLGRVQALDMHYYTSGKAYGTATEYTTDQWYGLLAKGLKFEEIALKHWEIMAEYDPGHSVKLAVCEWGSWHHPMPGTNPRFLRQQNSMRDGLLAALTLNIFNRHCDKIGMANIAQTINVLQCMILTDGPKMITTPTYHIFEMFVPHQGAEALECEALTERIHFNDGGNQPSMLPRIAACCSKKDGTLTLSVVNTHATDPTDLVVTFFPGLSKVRLKSWRVLSADDIHAHNTFDQPNLVVPRDMRSALGEKDKIKLPPASVSVLTYVVKE
ncbi:MAG TPA: alpha-L-arabinofuranosidase C-terminal domain-containing protein [Sedimentisphaerales bacterium]|nr:alpha-L-arabinofuranosidase C-terminal domain-containing protein [Sedimentisphaerales bacterium]